MASCALLATIALAIGMLVGMRCRVWALLPLAGAVACLPALGWLASPAGSAAPCVLVLAASQGGFLLGACLIARRSPAVVRD